MVEEGLLFQRATRKGGLLLFRREPSQCPYLSVRSLRNFRGIGPKIQKLDSFREFNFFIGPNNSAKSTILNFLHKHLNSFGSGSGLSNLDEYRGKETGTLMASIGIPLNIFIENVVRRVQGSRQIPSHLTNVIPTFCELIADGKIVWIKIPVGATGRPDYLSRPMQRSYAHVWRIVSFYNFGAS